GLGLKPQNGKRIFPDVEASDWHDNAVRAAFEHRLISGFEDGSFRPDEKLTREQAAVIIASAMKLTGLKDQLQRRPAAETIQAYQDAGIVSAWALESMADVVQA